MTEPHSGYINTLDDGTRIHTYHPMPAVWCCRQHLLDLPPESDQFGVAVHEAGHLVAALVGGIHVAAVTLTFGTASCRHLGSVPALGGSTEIGRVAVPADDYLIMLAAGEQAHQRWLVESVFDQTPGRVWAVERGAWDDTEKAIGWLRDLCPPEWPDDWLRVKFWGYRPAARALLGERWERVLKVAGVLADRLHLPGDEAADLVGLKNPVEPAS